MQKNWYLVYTKPKCEKKVSALLTKKKIENFCPQNRKQIQQIRKNKLVIEPLFNSYVFVRISEEKILDVKQLENVLNLVYWKGVPAIIKDEEINIIMNFINDHQNIRIEKTSVDVEDSPKVVDPPAYSIDGHILTLKNTSVKVNLPSLGYILIAEIDREESILGRQTTFSKELSLQ
ncbi:MAG: UpxY family transcription antiterminator [Ginsengibacter sp.]